MGGYIGAFQNILSSVKFGSATYTGSSYSQNGSAWTTITRGNNQVGLNIRLNNLVDFCMKSLPSGITACDNQLRDLVRQVCTANNDEDVADRGRHVRSRLV